MNMMSKAKKRPWYIVISRFRSPITGLRKLDPRKLQKNDCIIERLEKTVCCFSDILEKPLPMDVILLGIIGSILKNITTLIPFS